MTIRLATLADIPALEQLIAQSARALAQNDYTPEQIESALGSAWGVDSQLIRDGTYFVVHEGGGLIACGGWSKRQALFGADRLAGSEPALLDPVTDAARIRAFFVHPAWARRGIGSELLARCESEARAAGFQRAELVATLPGERLYQRHGYEVAGRQNYALPNGGHILFVRMRKGRL